MANTYTHTVISLKKSNGLYINTINSATIEVTVSDGTNSLAHNYELVLEEPTGDPTEVFTIYEDVTEAQVISWFTNNFIEYDHVKNDIDKKLKASLQVSVQSNFPWS